MGRGEYRRGVRGEAMRGVLLPPALTIAPALPRVLRGDEARGVLRGVDGPGDTERGDCCSGGGRLGETDRARACALSYIVICSHSSCSLRLATDCGDSTYWTSFH